MTPLVGSSLQLVLLLIGAPLIVGVMGKVRARTEGRVGAPVFQLLFDLRKQFAKEQIHAEHSSAVFAVAPFVYLASAAVGVVMTPLVTKTPLFATGADLFVIIYLLLMGTVALALGGLDPGTAFGGMGSSRAMTIGALAEPALLVSMFALAIQAGGSNLTTIISSTIAHPTWVVSPQHLLAMVALFIVILAETGRIPFDNPETHLELTMIHEAMVLEYAGPELALVNLGGAIRLVLLFGLAANLLFPWGIATTAAPVGLMIGVGALCMKVTALAVLVALFEVRNAKLRLFRVPELLSGGFVLGVLAIVTGLVTR